MPPFLGCAALSHRWFASRVLTRPLWQGDEGLSPGDEGLVATLTRRLVAVVCHATVPAAAVRASLRMLLLMASLPACAKTLVDEDGLFHLLSLVCPMPHVPRRPCSIFAEGAAHVLLRACDHASTVQALIQRRVDGSSAYEILLRRHFASPSAPAPILHVSEVILARCALFDCVRGIRAEVAQLDSLEVLDASNTRPLAERLKRLGKQMERDRMAPAPAPFRSLRYAGTAVLTDPYDGEVLLSTVFSLGKDLGALRSY